MTISEKNLFEALEKIREQIHLGNLAGALHYLNSLRRKVWGGETAKNEAAVALGKKGGEARAASLSSAQLSEIARKGAAKRWQDKAPSMSKAAIYQRNRRKDKTK